MKQEETKRTREPFFIVPSRVFDENLTPYELAVLFYLMMKADNETHTCFPSEKGIAKACGVSHPTVTRVIKALKEKKLISVKKQYAQTKNGMNRQTSNLYEVLIYEITPHNQSEHPPSSERTPPLITEMREINKTKPNRTKTNISISTSTTEEGAEAEEEKARFSFLELKRECFEILKNERGMDEEDILLLDRAIQYLWFKKSAEYEGKEYSQDELRALLADKTTPDILGASLEFLSASKEPVRSPVAYLGKCILGGLVNGFLDYKRQQNIGGVPDDRSKEEEMVMSVYEGESSFDADDFFAAALRNSYEKILNSEL